MFCEKDSNLLVIFHTSVFQVKKQSMAGNKNWMPYFDRKIRRKYLRSSKYLENSKLDENKFWNKLEFFIGKGL